YPPTDQKLLDTTTRLTIKYAPAIAITRPRKNSAIPPGVPPAPRTLVSSFIVLLHLHRHAHCSIVIRLGFRGMLSQKTFRESDISGITRFAMNCQSCNTTIDYRFQTNCSDCETERVDLLAIDQIHVPVESKNRLAWTRRGVNLIYLLTISAAAMISGAVVLY